MKSLSIADEGNKPAQICMCLVYVNSDIISYISICTIKLSMYNIFVYIQYVCLALLKYMYITTDKSSVLPLLAAQQRCTCNSRGFFWVVFDSAYGDLPKKNGPWKSPPKKRNQKGQSALRSAVMFAICNISIIRIFG